MVSMCISMEQSLKCREVGFEMAIYWYRVAFARREVTASDSSCPADGVSLTVMSTLVYRIAFAPARKPYWILVYVCNKC